MTIRGFICLADIDANSSPIVPNGWRVESENNQWFSIIDESNLTRFFHARLMLTDPNVPGKGVFVLSGEKERMRNLYDWLDGRGESVWTLAELKADNSQRATRIKNAWLALHSGSSVELQQTMLGFDHAMALNQTNSRADLDD